MQVIYTARNRFGPSKGKEWLGYLRWSGLSHVREIVSLDHMLCPFAVGFTDDLWDLVVNEDHMLDYFLELEPLLQRLPQEGEEVAVLALIRRPESEVGSLAIPGFHFMGYDLMDGVVGNSALTNCGGFDEAFAGSELNDVGLLDSFPRSVEVRDKLKLKYPAEYHADCDIWAVFRMADAKSS
jgi:hypothetical protein